jgi:hypothetical protein
MTSQFTLLSAPAIAALCLAQEESAGKNELALGLGAMAAWRSNTPNLGARSGLTISPVFI